MRLPFIRLERAAVEPPPALVRPVVELVLDEPGIDGRPLGDLIAPAAITVEADHLILDGQFARVLALVGLPPVADVGWLEPLPAAALPAELSLFVAPADISRVADHLARRHIRLQSSQLHDVAEGRPADPEVVAGEEEIANLRHALARGAERPFDVALYVLLRAGSRAALDSLTRAAQDVLAALSGRLAVVRLQQEAGLHACLPEGTDALGMRHPLETSSLVTAYPFPPAGLDMPGGVPLGFDRRTRAPVAIDVFDDLVFRNANVVIFGPGGVGKSYDVKLWVLRTLLLDDNTDVLIVDPKHEYARLVDAFGEHGRFVRLAAASGQRVNPFDLPPAGPRQPPDEVFGDHIQQLIGLLELLVADPGARLGTRAHGRLDAAIVEVYRLAGITADAGTHVQPPPTLGDLQVVLDVEAEAGDETAENLAERLRPFTQGSLAGGLLHGETTISLDRRLTVFGLAELAEASWPVAMHLLAGWVWTQVRRQPGRQRLLVVDEAWRLLRHPAGAVFLEGLARLARAAGLGLVAISQDVKVVLGHEQGRTIAENAAAALLLGQTEETLRPLVEAYSLSEDEQQDLDPGHADSARAHRRQRRSAPPARGLRQRRPPVRLQLRGRGCEGVGSRAGRSTRASRSRRAGRPPVLRSPEPPRRAPAILLIATGPASCRGLSLSALLTTTGLLETTHGGPLGPVWRTAVDPTPSTLGLSGAVAECPTRRPPGLAQLGSDAAVPHAAALNKPTLEATEVCPHATVACLAHTHLAALIAAFLLTC